jgi:DNA-binding XRE family transcriptional regulator
VIHDVNRYHYTDFWILKSRFMSLVSFGGRMPKTVTSPLQPKLAALLAELRKKAGLRQIDLAQRLGVYQSWVTHMESGQRRIDVIELIEICEALGFGADETLSELAQLLGKRQPTRSKPSPAP